MKRDVSIWREDPVTQRLYNSLEKAKEITLEYITKLNPGDQQMQQKYFKLQSRLETIELILEADLELDEESEIDGQDYLL